MMGQAMRSVGFLCPSCGSTYEQNYYGKVLSQSTGEQIGHRLRCKECRYSWTAPRWGDGELVMDRLEEAAVEYEIGFVTIDMPYNEDLIDRLKTEIHPNERHWDADRKVWLVNDGFWEEARAIIEDFYVIVE